MFEGGKGHLLRCDIHDNKSISVYISSGADPLVSECKIRNGESSGVLCELKGKGRLERCEIFANGPAKHAGVLVLSAGDPTVVGCTIRDQRGFGVQVMSDARGRANVDEDSCVFSNNAEGDVMRW